LLYWRECLGDSLDDEVSTEPTKDHDSDPNQTAA